MSTSGKTLPNYPPRTRSEKAGIQFPVSCIHRYLRKGRYADRISFTATVFMATVLEYLIVEVLEPAGHVAREDNKVRITPRHLQLSIRSDAELDKVFSSITIAEGGVIPNIHTELHIKLCQVEKIIAPK